MAKKKENWYLARVELVFRSDEELNTDDVRAYLHGHGTGVIPSRFNIDHFGPLMKDHPAYGQLEFDDAVSDSVSRLWPI